MEIDSDTFMEEMTRREALLRGEPVPPRKVKLPPPREVYRVGFTWKHRGLFLVFQIPTIFLGYIAEVAYSHHSSPVPHLVILALYEILCFAGCFVSLTLVRIGDPAQLPVPPPPALPFLGSYRDSAGAPAPGPSQPPVPRKEWYLEPWGLKFLAFAIVAPLLSHGMRMIDGAVLTWWGTAVFFGFSWGILIPVVLTSALRRRLPVDSPPGSG